MLLDVDVYSYVGVPAGGREVGLALARVFESRSGLYTADAVRIFSGAGPAMTTVAFPPYYRAIDEIARELSGLIARPVMAFESDLSLYWAYYLCEVSDIVDMFATVPARVSYSRGARTAFRGNPYKLAAVWPDITEDGVRPYLTHWDRPLARLGKKALPDDEFPIGSGWQLLDFIRHLHLPFDRREIFSWP